MQGFIDATPIGERSLKGKSELVNLFRLDLIRGGVTRFGAKLSQGLTPLQERANELLLLEQLWSGASDGNAKAADVIGEAGIGKSRLLFEFEESLRDKNALILAAACSSEESATPFFPFIELVRRSLGLNRDADRAAFSGTLSRALNGLNLDNQKIFPYLLDLLAGVDPPDCRLVHGKDDPQCKTVGLDCGLPEQLDDIDWRKQICDTAVTFCALSGAADPSSVCANLRPPCDWHPGRSACSAG